MEKDSIVEGCSSTILFVAVHSQVLNVSSVCYQVQLNYSFIRWTLTELSVLPSNVIATSAKAMFRQTQALPVGVSTQRVQNNAGSSKKLKV